MPQIRSQIKTFEGPTAPCSLLMGLGLTMEDLAKPRVGVINTWSDINPGHVHLRPVAEAEARERAFVCTASHGLVTPLMAVTANCDVLEAEASDQAGLASWVANIRAAADEMATRIADMLMHMGGD